MLIGVLFFFGLGYGFDFNAVLFTQPGHHLLEMLSRLSSGLVEKKSDFKHADLLRIKSSSIWSDHTITKTP